jgi:hypothetical protein
LETFKKPRNRFLGIHSASLCNPAGWYDKPILTRFLAPIDCSKSPALAGRFDNPIPTPFLASIDCSKIPAQAADRLAESVPWNRFLGSLNVYKFGLRRSSVSFDTLFPEFYYKNSRKQSITYCCWAKMQYLRRYFLKERIYIFTETVVLKKENKCVICDRICNDKCVICHRIL